MRLDRNSATFAQRFGFRLASRLTTQLGIGLCAGIVMPCGLAQNLSEAGMLPVADATSGARAAAERSPVMNFAQIAIIQQLAQQVMDTYPDLRARRQSWEASVELVKVARSSYMPRVDLSGALGQDQVTRATTPSGTTTIDGATQRFGVAVVQPLFDGFATASDVERAARQGNVRYFEMLQTQEDLSFEVLRALVEIERSRALRDLTRANLGLLEDLTQLVRSRVESGVSRRVDFEQASSRLSAARTMLASDEGSVLDASARYQRAMLRPAPESRTGVPLLDVDLPRSDRDAVERALNQQPNLMAAVENMAGVAAELKGRRSAYMPRVSVEGRHEFVAKSAATNNQSLPASSVLMTMNMNLYSGGGDRAREREVIARREQLREEFERTRVDVRQAVLSSHADMHRLRSVLKHVSSYVAGVERTREAYMLQYKINQRSLLDLLNTENEVFQARRQQVNAMADLSLATGRLHALTGNLVQVLGLRRPDIRPLIQPVGMDGAQALLAGLSSGPTPELVPDRPPDEPRPGSGVAAPAADPGRLPPGRNEVPEPVRPGAGKLPQEPKWTPTRPGLRTDAGQDQRAEQRMDLQAEPRTEPGLNVRPGGQPHSEQAPSAPMSNDPAAPAPRPRQSGRTVIVTAPVTPPVTAQVLGDGGAATPLRESGQILPHQAHRGTPWAGATTSTGAMADAATVLPTPQSTAKPATDSDRSDSEAKGAGRRRVMLARIEQHPAGGEPIQTMPSQPSAGQPMSAYALGQGQPHTQAQARSDSHASVDTVSMQLAMASQGPSPAASQARPTGMPARVPASGMPDMAPVPLGGIIDARVPIPVLSAVERWRLALDAMDAARLGANYASQAFVAPTTGNWSMRLQDAIQTGQPMVPRLIRVDRILNQESETVADRVQLRLLLSTQGAGAGQCTSVLQVWRRPAGVDAWYIEVERSSRLTAERCQ